MDFNGSFGDGEIEEEEIDLKKLAKMKENENSIDNIYKYSNSDTVPKNNDIFNSVFATEIYNNDDPKKIEYFETQLIQEKINYTLNGMFTAINNHMNSYKMSFIYKLKYILNQKYSKLITAEILYMNIKTKMDHIFYLFQFMLQTKLKKSFYKIKNYSYLKRRQQEQEQLIKKEKENKIQTLNNKLNSVGNSLTEMNRKINILNNIQKKLSNENKEIKNKNNQLNEKMNQLIKIGNSLKEIISNKKNIYNNNTNNKNQESIIQNLQNLIEQKETEKENTMIDVDDFYQKMDIILSQYESISETILSNCNINTNK